MKKTVQKLNQPMFLFCRGRVFLLPPCLFIDFWLPVIEKINQFSNGKSPWLSSKANTLLQSFQLKKKKSNIIIKNYNHRISVQQKVVSIITAVLKSKLNTRNLNFNSFLLNNRLPSYKSNKSICPRQINLKY